MGGDVAEAAAVLLPAKPGLDVLGDNVVLEGAVVELLAVLLLGLDGLGDDCVGPDFKATASAGLSDRGGEEFASGKGKGLVKFVGERLYGLDEIEGLNVLMFE